MRFGYLASMHHTEKVICTPDSMLQKNPPRPWEAQRQGWPLEAAVVLFYFPPCHVPPLNLTLPTGILKHLLIPHFNIQSCNIWQLANSNRNYLCVTPWRFKSFRKKRKQKENMFTCKLKNYDLQCIFVGRPTLLAYHPMSRCLLSILFVYYSQAAANESAVGCSA